MSRKPKFKPVVTRVKLNPEQAVLSCNCYAAGNTTSIWPAHYDQFVGGGGLLCVWNGRSTAYFTHVAGVHWGYGLGSNVGAS